MIKKILLEAPLNIWKIVKYVLIGLVAIGGIIFHAFRSIVKFICICCEHPLVIIYQPAIAMFYLAIYEEKFDSIIRAFISRTIELPQIAEGYFCYWNH
ncbi:MAG: hypothetical protein LUC35_08395 [Clostridiales bacterium]|nr:hypothetical protein [Clostridiales bacterium]